MTVYRIKEKQMFSIKTIVILSFLGLYSFASEQMSIDQQINAIKHASPAQRVEMMNNLKRNIATMQASQRTETINKLRANLSQHKASPSQSSYNNGYQNEQMQHNNDIQHTEMMVQTGTIDLFIQQNSMLPHPATSSPNQVAPDNIPQSQNNFKQNGSH